MSLQNQREAIRHLVDEHQPADAMAAYFAFYYPGEKVVLRPFPEEAARANGYVCYARTGMDLFRPLVTMRLPIADIQASADVIYAGINAGAPLILNVSEDYGPLVNALFEVQSEEKLHLFVYGGEAPQQVINILVTQDVGANGLQRFVIRDRQHDDVLVASAGLNWQTQRYAEISVNTHPRYRRQGYGRSVVAAMVDYLLARGKVPLYVASATNQASIQLAGRIGFMDTGQRQLMIQGSLKSQ